MSACVWLSLYALGYVLCLVGVLQTSLPADIKRANDDLTSLRRALGCATMYGMVLLLNLAWPFLLFSGGKKGRTNTSRRGA